MSAEQDGLDLAKVMREHLGLHTCGHRGFDIVWHPDREGRNGESCLPYRLAALALDLQGKVARVEALFAGGPDTPCRTTWQQSAWPTHPFDPVMIECVEVPMDDLRAALADPTSAARCPQQTPFEALSEPTCTRPEGHEGAHLFTSYDGKTPLEMMPK